MERAKGPGTLMLTLTSSIIIKYAGDRLVKGAMAKVVGVLQAHMDGDFETRLKGKQEKLSLAWVEERWSLSDAYPPPLLSSDASFSFLSLPPNHSLLDTAR